MLGEHMQGFLVTPMSGIENIPVVTLLVCITVFSNAIKKCTLSTDTAAFSVLWTKHFHLFHLKCC